MSRPSQVRTTRVAPPLALALLLSLPLLALACGLPTTPSRSPGTGAGSSASTREVTILYTGNAQGAVGPQSCG